MEFFRKCLNYFHQKYREYQKLFYTAKDDYTEDAKAFIFMIESTVIVFFAILIPIGLCIYYEFYFPKYQSFFWPILTSYFVAILTIFFSQRFTLYKNQNKYRNGKSEIVEKDALYVFLETSKLKYDRSIYDDIASWKFEPDSKKKKAIMNKIIDNLIVELVYPSESIHKEHALTNPVFIGILIDYINEYTIKKSRMHITSTTKESKREYDELLKDELCSNYGLNRSLLDHRFAEFKKAFGIYSRKYLQQPKKIISASLNEYP